MSSRDRDKAAANYGAWRSVRRKQLDLQLGGLDERLGPDPELGWIRIIREALGMSGSELGVRLGVSRQRVDQLEQAELARTMPISTLDRVAAALGCRVRFAFVPDEPLERMVRRQALRRAAAAMTASGDRDLASGTEPLDLARNAVMGEGESLQSKMLTVTIEAIANDLVDRRGLWAAGPRGCPPSEPV